MKSQLILRRLVTIGVATAAALATIGITVAPAHAATAHRPVILIHGWNGSAAAWDPFVAWMRADGYTADEVYTLSYPSGQSNVTTAGQLSTLVDQVRAATGWDKVDIVTHSMGALSSRYYIKNLGGVDKVDDWVSIAGPNHGTDLANSCFWDTACTEMRPGSAFLTALNAGDETPGAVRYGTWHSTCDEVVYPQVTTELVGATNTVTPTCIKHNDFQLNRGIYEQVRDFIGGPTATNYALSATATASSIEGDDTGSLRPAMAIDNSMTTRWGSDWNVDPQWIKLDLGQTRTIKQVTLRWQDAYGSSYVVETSTDGSTWTQVYSTTTGDGRVDVANFTSRSARYVRLTGKARGNGYGYSLWELAVT